MAKKRKIPKKPKQSSTIAVWENWEKRKKVVVAYNKQLETDKKKKEALIARNR